MFPEEALDLGDTNSHLDQVSLEEPIPRLGRSLTTRWLGRLRHTKFKSMTMWFADMCDMIPSLW